MTVFGALPAVVTHQIRVARDHNPHARWIPSSSLAKIFVLCFRQELIVSALHSGPKAAGARAL